MANAMRTDFAPRNAAEVCAAISDLKISGQLTQRGVNQIAEWASEQSINGGISAAGCTEVREFAAYLRGKKRMPFRTAAPEGGETR